MKMRYVADIKVLLCINPYLALVCRFCRFLATVLTTVLFVVSVLSDASPQEERDAVLEFHTAKRGNVTPTAANMKMMVRCPCFSTYLFEHLWSLSNDSVCNTFLLNHLNISLHCK